MHEKTDEQKSEAVLPEGRHFAVTWSLPSEFAGRTNAMLHRSRAFAKYGGRPVEILTFDDFRDYSEIRRTLAEKGFLAEGTTIRNLWEDLPALADGLSLLAASATPDDFVPLSTTDTPRAELDGPHPRRARYSADGSVLLQVDHFRDDGSLLLSDRHDAQQYEVHEGRSLTLCDRSGDPVHRWGSSWGLYRSWLDHLIGTDSAWFVVDNKNMARFMASFKRENALVLYQIHESHLASDAGDFSSELSPSAKAVFPRLDLLDGVIYLTEQQASDVHGRYGDIGNSYVVPNSRDLGSGTRTAERRNPATGIQVARLSQLKRVHHSVEAVNRVTTKTGQEVRLDVYGEGSQRASLEALIRESGLERAVTLKGHVPNAQEFFAEASFSLLTSTSEAMPLVILESMAGGCIPISYDIRYGPASIIEHGISGFIVEYGNLDSLAEHIGLVISMPDSDLARLRDAAIQRAKTFADLPIVERWSSVMEDARIRKNQPKPMMRVDLHEADYAIRSGGRLEVGLRVTADVQRDLPAPLEFFCSMRIRSEESFFRVRPKRAELQSDGAFHLAFEFDPAVVNALRSHTVDLYLETKCLNTHIKTRLRANVGPTTMEAYSTKHGNLSMTMR